MASDMQANFLSQQFGLDARVSQETATLVDVETRRILEEAVDEASSILESHRLALDSLADLLCEQETVDGAQIDAILGQNVKQEEGKEFLRHCPKRAQAVSNGCNDEGRRMAERYTRIDRSS